MSDIDEATRIGMATRAAQIRGQGPPPAQPAIVTRAAAQPVITQVVPPVADQDLEDRLVALQQTDQRQQAQINDLTDQLSTHTRLGDAWADGIEQRLNLVEANPQTNATWPGLIAKWTSRETLLTFGSVAVAILTLIGSTFGSLDQRIPLVTGAAATFLSGLFVIMRSLEKKAVAVEEVRAAGRLQLEQTVQRGALAANVPPRRFMTGAESNNTAAVKPSPY